MASPRTLLSKLAQPPSSRSRGLPDAPDQLLDSIRGQIQQILNSRQDNAPTAPSYGTPSFSDLLRSRESTRRMEEEISKTIEQFEPRLANVSVLFSPDEDNPQCMYFDITADIVDEEENAPAIFRTMVEESGAVRVDRG